MRSAICLTFCSSILNAEPLLVFVEVVATNGAITAERQIALRAIATEAGYRSEQVAFVSALLDRDSQGFKKTASRLAWGSFAWFVSEPDCCLRDERADLGSRDPRDCSPQSTW
ncbi:MAG: BsuBI/PstI family type II restriction endonuclease [Candidatus Rokuibacteriota bacterium]